MCHVFFSYAQNDVGDVYLNEFYDDLVTEVRQKTGTIPSTEPLEKVVFRAREGISVGADRNKILVDNLQSCKRQFAQRDEGDVQTRAAN